MATPDPKKKSRASSKMCALELAVLTLRLKRRMDRLKAWAGFDMTQCGNRQESGAFRL